ncbi:ParB protein [Clostridium sp. DL-VIII]|uniref:ParB/RepB/Spo0J family partition protein n=1 Tax=Clostridium sp. DL-VIII TaxID=641107 RepID=UPI00023AF7B6|nr:ParB/RepB/Spo0J family partition protein [Clostridium sp. DL-VIII]EHI98018.1 ParB protein [Clostridium sp. DL-VIII]
MSNFNMMSLVNSKSKGIKEINTEDYKRIKLDPRNVIPSQSNFYSQDNIEELADTFLLVGQQQPTVLGRVNNEFRIISGHRRNLANILNIERGHKEYEEVEYLYKDMTEAFFELSLIIGNAFTRKLSPFEETEQVIRLKKALIRARDEDGLEIKGKLRNVVAELMNTSRTQVARMEAINNNLTEEAKEQFKEGNLGITVAYETSKLPEEEQKEIAKKVANGEEIKSKDIVTVVQETRKETVSVSDTKANEENDINLVVIDNDVVDKDTGEIVEQIVPEYLSKSVIDRIKEMTTSEMADFLCEKCTGIGGGNGCSGLCDFALSCKYTNRREVCLQWLNSKQ